MQMDDRRVTFQPRVCWVASFAEARSLERCDAYNCGACSKLDRDWLGLVWGLFRGLDPWRLTA